MEKGVLVDAGWVASHLDDDDVRIVEVDVSGAGYDDGHIPGAILWDAYKDLRHPDYTPTDVDEIDRLLERSGVSPDTTLVFYGYAPHLGRWLMDRHGHERALIMDGGREAWESSAHEWSTDVREPEPSIYERRDEKPDLVVSLEELVALIDTAGTVILDVRSPEEFTGERFWPSGATEDVGRPGHIPGAAHVPVDLVRDQGDGPPDPEAQRLACARAGVIPERRIVTYCTIGNRASEVAFTLKQVLGYPDVAIYYGSWAEWGHQPDSPIET
jgi:thiosulfate/3-mercaptopyruvate sulfurtransferase